MQESDKAIVLGSVSVKNNANVIKAFSQNHGLLSLYLSPAAKKKAARNAVLQPLSLVELSYSSNKRSSLLNLKEARITHPLFGIQGDIFKNSMALFLADVLNKIVPEDHDKDLYDFMANAILLFNEVEEGKANFHIAFLLRLTKWLGFYPNFRDDPFSYLDLQEGEFINGKPNHPHYLNRAESNYIARFLQSEWSVMNEIKMVGKERGILLKAIINYYALHVPGFKEPKSLSILEEVFS